ncbi:MAG TPA: alpha/beta hydrolase [Caulobacteraceae bacterium]|jgi:pimeloyl-ACP methyl ester carboxylesterase|nr:alpha/beta hydrolase [Caulobacteraceae bacterium]
MPHAKANGLDIYYETHGPDDAEPILLIMGLGAQMSRWSPDFIRKLVEDGHRVIAYDNRDVGLSEKLDAAGAPDIGAVVQAVAEKRKPPVAYTLQEMAADAAGLLEALGIERAHIVGASMGGMIAQLVAADHPERTLSLTSIMSSTGNPDLPRATPEAMARLNTPAPDPTQDLEGFLASAVAGAKVMAGTYPVDEALVRENALSDFRRSFYPVGFQRQYAAILASPDRRPKLATITAPTVVVHGADDPLVPLAGGRDTAENIPGAELRIVPGVGHEMPLPTQDQFIDAILSAVARAKVSA